MLVKVQWIIDGVAEMEADSLEEAELIVNETLIKLSRRTLSFLTSSAHALSKAKVILLDRMKFQRKNKMRLVRWMGRFIMWHCALWH